MEIVLPDGTPALTSDLFIKEYTSLFNKNDAKKAMKFIEKFRQAVDEADLKSAMQGKCLNLLKPEGEGVFSFFPEGHHNGTNSRVCGYIRDGKFVYTGSALHGPQYSALIAETKRQAKIYSKLPLPTPEIAELSSQTANIVQPQIDVNEVFKNNEHIRQKCYDLHGEYHNAKSPDDLKALKKMCLDPETGFLPNTVEGKQTILKYAETDSEFKKFLEDAYTEYEKIHPLKTEAEVKAEAEARRNQSNRDRLNSVHANREDITNEWRLIDSQNPSKGYVRTISQQYQARQMMDKLKVLDIECEYDPQTKSIRITDPQSIDKFNTFKGDGGNPGGGDPDGKDPNGGKTSNGESVPDKSKSTLLGTPKSSTLSQSSWQDIDANDSSKGIQKIVKNKTEARQIMAVYQKAGIKCTYNEQTKSLQVTDSQSITKIRELEARGTATDVDNIHSINGNGRKPHIPGQRVRPNSGNKSNGHAVRGRTAARKVFR